MSYYRSAHIDELAANWQQVPAEPGTYGVFYRLGELGIELSRPYMDTYGDQWTEHAGVYSLLYVGATGQSLRRRLKRLIKDDSRGHSLRVSLGALLGLKAASGTTPGSAYFGAGEHRITQSLHANSKIFWKVHGDVWEHEARLRSTMIAPLNLDSTRASAFGAHMRRVRWSIFDQSVSVRKCKIEKVE